MRIVLSSTVGGEAKGFSLIAQKKLETLTVGREDKRNEKKITYFLINNEFNGFGDG